MDSSKTTFYVSAKGLLKKLKIAHKVVGSGIIPILDNFLFILEDGLTIISSDLQTTLVTDVDIAGIQGSCRIAIPAKRLIDLVSVCGDTALTFEISGTTITISTGTGEYVIEGFKGAEFPMPPDVEGNFFTIESSSLLWGLEKTSFCAAIDDDRPVLSGVNFLLKDKKLYFAATDYFRMSECQSETDSDATEEFILPIKSVGAVVGMLGKKGDVLVRYNDKNISFCLEKTVVVCRRVDGKFPNYKALLGQEMPIVSQLNVEQFLSAVKRVSIFAPKKSGMITLKFKEDSLLISTQDVDYGISGDETLVCSSTGHASISFKSDLLIDALNHMEGDTVTVKLKDEVTACCLYNESTNNTILMMPMRTI